MEATLSRPAASALSCCCRTTSTPRLVPGLIRHQSTKARTKRMLNIPKHESFLNPRPQTNHIIFNPPSSEASVYHTPFKFLPKNDPRRRAQLPQLFATSTTIQYPQPSENANPEELPAAFPPELGTKKYHMTKEDVEEMRRLRLEDPVTNTVTALSQKFGCTPWFVMMCVKSPREHRDQHKAREAAIKAKWGPKRTAAREERARRWAMLFRGEI
ncbi:mitochondrial ribosomal protein subunit L20-domain-containing protein [Podospora fimiseda]|uniref:Mitochondrial ribosomal protein subunit L20-domain-containing protein n=1 Tax=Podospora fimiseda TaxID=252190 RepID=A0AAN7BU02_9PEZI|nr:mitochondrial ribosomal protein subunit L20-domain-containing protein [Podospora fimiseda]